MDKLGAEIVSMKVSKHGDIYLSCLLDLGTMDNFITD